MKDTLHIYTRVSSTIQEEEGTSLKTQKEIGIELSNKLGMKYQVHNEGGISSSKDTLENRPVMLNVLRLMEEGKIKNLYVWNTDRLSRNQITWFSIRRTMVGRKVYVLNGGRLGRPEGTKETEKDFLEKPQTKEIIKNLKKGLIIKDICKIVDCSNKTIIKTKKIMKKSNSW